MSNSAPLLSILALLGAGTAIALTFRTAADTDSPTPGDFSGSLAAREIADLKDQVRQLESRLSDASSPADRSVSVEDQERRIEAIVARLMAEQAGGGGAQATDATAKSDFNVDAAVAELIELNSYDDEFGAVWERIEAAGLSKEAMAAFERRAAESPNSPDAQADLGDAWIRQIMTSQSMPDTIRYSASADAAFDQALALEPTHWRARFNKAVSYSFWPAITGKPSEAVDHFNTLIQQQESSGKSEPHHAETYLLLGNLYDQQGKSDEARKNWSRGASLFPSHEGLRSKTQN